MKSTLMWIVFGGAILLFGGRADAWGALFNRFSPEMLANMGYGGQHGGGYPSFLQNEVYVDEEPITNKDGSCNDLFCTNNENCCLTGQNCRNSNEVYVDEEPITNKDGGCNDLFCTNNENCCPGQICIKSDGIDEGVCVFVYGRRLGELCRQDTDCEGGLVCDIAGGGTSGMVCKAPLAIAKQYAEDCTSSSECDITRGLCCQLQRRHRQAPRKVCSYFKDPLICIGRVAIDQIKHHVQHTAGEKRLTSAYRHGFN